MKNNYLGQAWLVVVLALVFGAALAGVQAQLSGKIADNKRNDTLGQVPQLVNGAARGQAVTLGDRTVYQALDTQDQLMGWVLPAGGPGFADRIEVLVGLNADATRITGLYVLDQKETPGLGNKITEPPWRAQFQGLDATRAISIAKASPAGDNQVVAVTGATISSQSVAGIVNQNVQWLRAQLARERKGSSRP
jgi:electron transport complex protein RnfG